MASTGIFHQLIELNGQAFTEGSYDKASYLLTAALFCARSEADQGRCIQVERIAAAQSHLINELAPDYLHSSEAAPKRAICNQGIFDLLAQRAHGTASYLNSPLFNFG